MNHWSLIRVDSQVWYTENVGASTSELSDDVISPHPSSTSSLGSSSSFSSPHSFESPSHTHSLWPNIPKPPSAIVDHMLQDASTGKRTNLRMF